VISEIENGNGRTYGELVLGEGSSLVTAQNVDSGKGLDGGEPSDDGLLLGEDGGTDGEGGGGHSGKGDGDRGDSENGGQLDDVGEILVAVVALNEDDEDEEDIDDKEGGADGVQDLTEVRRGASLAHELGGLSHEGAGTSGRHHGVASTTLHRR